ncbi:O-antigen ligase family protein [Psychrobacter sp. T6-1]|uniref:O-antigen ligase family protein n=1 Tax=Psychrobacter sp. T6-1 TaxID=3457447 RepID=UPI003FD61FB1
MAIISKERTFTLEKLKNVSTYDLSGFFLFMLMFLPFMIFKRTSPQFAFYPEIASAILVSLFLLFSSLNKKSINLSNRVPIYFFAIALCLTFDLLINPPVYISISFLYIGVLTLGAFLSQSVIDSLEKPQEQRLVYIVFSGLVVGAILQDIVILLQILHLEWLYGWIFYLDEGKSYSGNIGQRNMTAHYLFWGILATSYLLYKNKLTILNGYTLIILQAIFLGFINSRSSIVYLVVISCLLPIIYFWQHHLSKRIFKILFITLLLILIFQFLSLPLLALTQHNELISSNSISRLSNISNINLRTAEWHKAWLIFLDHPFFGSGWNSYGYEGFVKFSDVRSSDVYIVGHFSAHTHNLLFNFLAETGIFGTVIVVGGFLYLLSPLLSIPWKPETLVLLLMVTVSVIHSMLEYPLWYSHFFLVFVVLLTLLHHSIRSVKNIKVTHPIVRLIMFVISITYLTVSLNLYVSYSELDKLYYRFIDDNTPEEKVVTAVKMLEIADKQPLLRAYADIKSVDYLRLVPSDKIPSKFDDPLRRYAHYTPFPTAGIYYLITQCDNTGNWSGEDWQYYSYLSYQYKEAVPNFSIIMSMTDSCPIVYKEVNKQCKEYEGGLGDNVCSMDEAKASFSKK